MTKMIELNDTTLIIRKCGECPMRNYDYYMDHHECMLDDFITVRHAGEIHPKCRLKDYVVYDACI